MLSAPTLLGAAVVTRLVVACALATLLAACGSGSKAPAETDSGEATSQEAGSGSEETEASEEVTVERGPTCGALKVPQTAKAVGLGPDQWESTEYEPGDTFKIPGGGKQKITNWSCSLQSRPDLSPDDVLRQVRMTLVVYGDDYTLAERDKSVDESLKYAKQDKARCEVSEAEGWGEHGVYRTCSKQEKSTPTTYILGNTTARYEGLFGSVRVACDGASFPKGGDRAFVRTVDSVCTQALAELTR